MSQDHPVQSTYNLELIALVRKNFPEHTDSNFSFHTRLACACGERWFAREGGDPVREVREPERDSASHTLAIVASVLTDEVLTDMPVSDLQALALRVNAALAARGYASTEVGVVELLRPQPGDLLLLRGVSREETAQFIRQLTRGGAHGIGVVGLNAGEDLSVVTDEQIEAAGLVRKRVSPGTEQALRRVKELMDEFGAAVQRFKEQPDEILADSRATRQMSRANTEALAAAEKRRADTFMAEVAAECRAVPPQAPPHMREVSDEQACEVFGIVPIDQEVADETVAAINILMVRDEKYRGHSMDTHRPRCVGYLVDSRVATYQCCDTYFRCSYQAMEWARKEAREMLRKPPRLTVKDGYPNSANDIERFKREWAAQIAHADSPAPLVVSPETKVLADRVLGSPQQEHVKPCAPLTVVQVEEAAAKVAMNHGLRLASGAMTFCSMCGHEVRERPLATGTFVGCMC